MRSVAVLLVAASILPGELTFAQQRKTRDELVRDDLSNFGSSDAWIYNDLNRAFGIAHQTGKPLLVVFRCIPCQACAQLDQSIVERDLRVQGLLDQYVSVRIVHANGMDLSLFQFDYDQSFAAFMMNGDRTIYGRYGTRSHQTRSEDDVSLEGFVEALESGLQIHALYPGNQQDLAGKQPTLQPQYRTPEQFPRLAKYTSKLDYEGKVAASCIHCHQVGETLVAAFRDEGQAVPDRLVFPYPHPKILGLVMDPKQRATVMRVESGSTADRSGIRAGDKLLTLAGQSIISVADIQWVLHHAGDGGTLNAVVQRGDHEMALPLSLARGWRAEGDISWRATSWGLRRMTLGGLKLDEIPPDQRAERRLADDSLALVVSHVGEFGEHAHAKNQGFRKGDILVSIDGRAEPLRETDIFALLVNRPIGTQVPTYVRRGEQLLNLGLSTQR